MTTLDTSTSAMTWRRFGWMQAIGLHLGPGAAAFVAALLMAPLMNFLRLPVGFSLTIAFAVVLTPIELALLLRATHRATGSWSIRAMPAILGYPRRLGRAWLLVPVLFAVALGIAVVWTPAGAAIGGHLSGLYPGWMLPGYDDTAGFAKPILIVTIFATLVVDGVVNPIVEELWFRGYLLPRLPAAGWTAAPWSAALFAAQHYWQPYNWPLIFVLQLIIIALVMRLRCLRLGIVMHVLANCFGIVLGLLAVLA